MCDCLKRFTVLCRTVDSWWERSNLGQAINLFAYRITAVGSLAEIVSWGTWGLAHTWPLLHDSACLSD